MHLAPNIFRVLSTLSLLSAVSAIPGRALRQYHHRRSLLDICLYVDADVAISVGVAADVAVDLDVCLCVSALPIDVTAFVGLNALVNVYGEQKANELANKMVCPVDFR